MQVFGYKSDLLLHGYQDINPKTSVLQLNYYAQLTSIRHMIL